MVGLGVSVGPGPPVRFPEGVTCPPGSVEASLGKESMCCFGDLRKEPDTREW